MQQPLLVSRCFAPLFWCQFFAAFNDNFLKTALVFVLLFGSSANDAEALITAASAVFIAPYFFLSALGGEIADRFDKARVAQYLKFVEIFIAAVAVWGYTRDSLQLLFAALFGFGILAALFGPIKYGILPDHLRRDQLPAGNALIEGATFVAILLGTMTAGLAARFGANHFYFAALLVGVAFACWISALFIPPSGVGSPSLRVDANIFASTVATIRYLRRDTRLWWGAMVTSWFWLIGIVVLSLVPPMIKTALGGNEDTVTIYLAIFSIAVGAGSGLAAAIARGRIILGTTLVGAMLIGVFSLDIGIMTFTLQSAEVVQGAAALKSVTGLRMAVDLCGLAMGGGLFIVPAFAAVQSWSEPAYRARTIAAVNVLNAAFMTAASVAVATMQKFGATIPGLFLTIGVATLLVAFAILKTMPKNKT
jgi:hypothetical protein